MTGQKPSPETAGKSQEWFPQDSSEAIQETQTPNEDAKHEAYTSEAEFAYGPVTNKSKRKRAGSRFKLGIIGGQSSGKTSYLYSLGRLKFHSSPSMDGLQIGSFTPEYSEFFSKINDQENRQNFQRTRIDVFNSFDMFTVARSRLKISVSAFDAAGENFVKAVDPEKFKTVPTNSAAFKVIRRLQKEILACDGFIFLIDGELADPEIKDQMRKNYPGAPLPHELLLHFSNFLSFHDGNDTEKITKPIDLVITKADMCAHGTAVPLTYFQQVLNSNPLNQSTSIPLEVGLNEAERFTQVYFEQLYNVSRYFAHRSFHAISCWGHEPEYYFIREDDNGDQKEEQITREKLQEYGKMGFDIRVCVKDIRPVCIEEPLIWMIDQFDSQKTIKRKRHLIRNSIIAVAALITVFLYPLISYTAGRGLEAAKLPRVATFVYTLTGGHPVFDDSFLRQWVFQRYVSLAAAQIKSGANDHAYDVISRIQKIRSESGGEVFNTILSDDALIGFFITLSENYLDNKQFQKSSLCLSQALEIQTSDLSVRSRRLGSILYTVRIYKVEGRVDQAAELIIPLFESTIKDGNLEKNIRDEIAQETSKFLTTYCDYLGEKKAYPQVATHLAFMRKHHEALKVNLKEIESRLFTTHVDMAEDLFSKGDSANAKRSLKDALHWIAIQDTKGNMAFVALVQNNAASIGFTDTLEYFSQIDPYLAESDSYRQSMRSTLFEFPKNQIRNNREKSGIDMIRTLMKKMPDLQTSKIIASGLSKHVAGLNNKDRLVFIDKVKSDLGNFSEFSQIEKRAVVDIAHNYLISGKPGEALILLKSRQWLRSEKQYKKLWRHAEKASTMAFIPGGKSAQGFYMDRFEVSNASYMSIAANHQKLIPDEWNQGIYRRISPNDSSPVIFVSWEQAKTYAKMKGLRLPSNKEWEQAWGSERYPWGKTFSANKTNTRENKSGRALNQKSPRVANDVSPYGVYAMGGNIQEFTSDTMLDESGNMRVIVKGGCFMFPGESMNKSLTRKIKSHLKLEHVGFRCALDLTP